MPWALRKVGGRIPTSSIASRFHLQKFMPRYLSPIGYRASSASRYYVLKEVSRQSSHRVVQYLISKDIGTSIEFSNLTQRLIRKFKYVCESIKLSI